ncbi:hypothetical protein CBM2587_A10096 [Cupriavidus taiwanensis]|uniref:Uncharacterized protein n=1 Tax=Cupriavidus taiwanensis TaxID=164546 RepID=A0A375BBF2_9BURK|nr:hypothetical protein CBM2587_A10096 [Cupriavidus taiwanensis]
MGGRQCDVCVVRPGFRVYNRRQGRSMTASPAPILTGLFAPQRRVLPHRTPYPGIPVFRYPGVRANLPQSLRRLRTQAVPFQPHRSHGRSSLAVRPCQP